MRSSSSPAEGPPPAPGPTTTIPPPRPPSLKELARLEAAFDAQRRFAANAAHELRTPLAIVRTEVDVALADPDASVDELRAMAPRCSEPSTGPEASSTACWCWPAATGASSCDTPSTWPRWPLPRRVRSPATPRREGGPSPSTSLARPCEATRSCSSAWATTFSTTPCATTSPADG
ncbi:MAG: hypothetical protein KY447_01835 [Actinobacteria bacterium]|nr:hypothetical protein [Actinomycetota bacterium]